MSHNDEGSTSPLILPISRDIPLDKKGKPDQPYNAMRLIEQAIPLETTINGFDSLQIRVLITLVNEPVSQMVLIKNERGNWTAELITMQASKIDTGFHPQVTREKKIPVSGWQSFIEHLTELNITGLKDFSSSPGKYYYTDEDLVVIESATKHHYKTVMIPSTTIRLKDTEETQHLEKILSYLETEFSFTRLRHNRNQ